MRWLFPFVVVVMSAALNWVYGVTSASISTLNSIYGGVENDFLLNSINYSFYYVYTAIGPMVPWLASTVPRGPLLFACVWLSFVATGAQCLFPLGFECLLAASFTVSIPQPVIGSSLSAVLREYVPAQDEARALAVFTVGTNFAAGAGYWAVLWFLPSSSPDNSTSILLYLMVPGLAVLGLCLGATLAYLHAEPAESWRPLTTSSLPQADQPKADERPTKACDRNQAVLWLMLLSFALQDGVGNALGLIFGQLSAAYQMTELDVATMMGAVSVASIVSPLAVGWIMDRTRAYHGLPSSLIVLQAIAQIGVFYWSPTATALTAWVAFFAIPNMALVNGFLPALTSDRVRSDYSPTAINSLMRWFTALFTSLSSLALLRVQAGSNNGAVVDDLAPMFLAVAILTIISSSAALLISQNSSPQPHSQPQNFQ